MIKDRTAALRLDLDGVAAPVRDRVVLFRMLTVLGTRLRGRMDARLRTDGITSQQAALLALASVERPPAQNEAARQLGVTHQNVRQIVDALVRKGLLTVHGQAGDRRVNRLVPTGRVARLFGRRNAADFTAVADWFSVLTDAEVASLLKLLGRLLAALPPQAETRESGVPADATPAAAHATARARRKPANRGERRARSRRR